MTIALSNVKTQKQNWFINQFIGNLIYIHKRFLVQIIGASTKKCFLLYSNSYYFI